MTSYRDLAAWLYLGNAAVLATHEIDSAFWHEWELFHLPGGIQLFLILNFALLLIVLFGLRKVVLWQPGAKGFSYFLAGIGVFAFAIHTIFILLGHPEFRLPVSVGLLTATLVLSTAQFFVTAKA